MITTHGSDHIDIFEGAFAAVGRVLAADKEGSRPRACLLRRLFLLFEGGTPKSYQCNALAGPAKGYSVTRVQVWGIIVECRSCYADLKCRVGCNLDSR